MWIDDEILCRCHEPHVLSTWVPKSSLVVLGSSNKADIEVKELACEEDGVPILKRYGGGGTVVLHSGCVVVSLGIWVSQFYYNDRYFRKINDAVIHTLAAEWREFSGLTQDGLSDLTFGERKIAGTSLFRSRNYLLYQASILVDARVDLMERYLKHPSREPDYRAGKSHRNFVAGLNEYVKSLGPSAVDKLLSEKLMPNLFTELEGELIAVQTKQCKHLYQRAGTIGGKASSYDATLDHVVDSRPH